VLNWHNSVNLTLYSIMAHSLDYTHNVYIYIYIYTDNFSK